jgi:hypothetical protein
MSSSFAQPASPRLRPGLLLSLLCLPVIAAYGLIFHFAVNIPYIDDYPNFLGFAVHFRQLSSPSEKLFYFVTVQHDEYKFVFMHIIALLELVLTHRVNMVVLSTVGDLFQLALLPLLWRMYIPVSVPVERKLLLFFPIVALVFGLNYAEGVTWPSSTLFYVPAIVFSFIAIDLLGRMPQGRPARLFAGACLAAFFACWTAPNSVLLLPIGLMLLLPRRAFAYAAIWCVALVGAAAPYLFRYHVLTGHGHVPGHASLNVYALFLLSFTGAAFPTLAASVPAGAVVLAVIAFAVRAGYHRRHPTAALGMVWLLASAILVTFGRARAGLPFALTPRYRVFSDLLLVFCYGFAIDRLSPSSSTLRTRQYLAPAACVFAGLNCLVADVHSVKVLRAHREQLFTGLSNYRSAPQVNSPMYFPDSSTTQMFSEQEVEARKLIGEAESDGVYKLPSER